MGSIGFLGLLVWSQMMAFPICEFWVINFAICWNSLVLIITLYSKNIINYTWSAGNLFLLFKIYLYIFYNTIQSASETTRETSFNLNPFFNKYPQYNNISINWLIWFIGFTEGDGALLNYNNKPRYVLTQKDNNILYHIHNTLNIGIVKNYNNFSRLIVTNINEIIILTYLFNGNLAIKHRINQLSSWINIINNNNYKFNLDNNIIFINKLVNISLNDSWLSGFTDAEGCFNVTITSNSRYKLNSVIKLRFILDQKDNDILNKICLLFNTGKVTLRDNNNNYRYTITGYKIMIRIINYFNKYELRTNKILSFKKWYYIYNMIINKEHLKLEGLLEIKILSKDINKKNSILKKIGNK